jgi:hypothetical protein
MIVLKPIIFYPGYAGCEATWVDRTQAPDIEHAEAPATFDEEGNELTTFVAAYTEAGAITDIQLKCHSYHPTQMDMLRADALSFGTSLAEYNDDINGIEAHYIPPAPPPVRVPQVITIRQAKLVLLAAGLLDDVDTAVAAADRVTQIEWEYATEVHRSWPTLTTLATVLGLSNETLDGLFIEGSAL